jgi:hypothetical protein
LDDEVDLKADKAYVDAIVNTHTINYSVNDMSPGEIRTITALDIFGTTNVNLTKVYIKTMVYETDNTSPFYDMLVDGNTIVEYGVNTEGTYLKIKNITNNDISAVITVKI